MNKLKSIVMDIITILAVMFCISLPVLFATFCSEEDKVPYAESHEEYVCKENNLNQGKGNEHR